MNKNSNKDKLKILSSNNVNLPDFINNNFDISGTNSINGTNVIRVPFGIRFSKKKRPEKNQNIATLILPITSVNSTPPPPNVA